MVPSYKWGLYFFGVVVLIYFFSAIRTHQEKPRPIDFLSGDDLGDSPIKIKQVCEPITHPENKEPIPYLVGKEVCYWIEVP